MYCLKCGKEIPDVSERCPNCGAPTENAGGGNSKLVKYEKQRSKVIMLNKLAVAYSFLAIAIAVISLVAVFIVRSFGIFAYSSVFIAIISIIVFKRVDKYAPELDEKNDKYKTMCFVSIGLSVIPVLISIF